MTTVKSLDLIFPIMLMTSLYGSYYFLQVEQSIENHEGKS